MTNLNINDFRILESMEMGLAILERDLNIVYWNPWLQARTNISADQAVNHQLDQLFPEVNRRLLIRKVKSALTLNTPSYYVAGQEGCLIKLAVDRIANPVFKYMQQSISIVPFGSDLNRVILVIYDQTPLREIQFKLKNKLDEINQLNEKLVTDTLTGLPTKPKLIEDIASSRLPLLSFIAIESFREVNDLYGHALGDKLLLFISKQIKQLIQEDPYHLYKMPGDEFAILSMHGNNPKLFYNLIDKIIKYLEKTNFKSESHDIPITLTAGIGCFKETLLRDTNLALEKAKSDKLSQYVIFDDSVDYVEEYKNNLKCISVVKKAIESNSVVPFIQRIINVKTGEIDKYETLARLYTSDNELWSPYQFLGAAKKARLYSQITKIMIEKTFNAFKDKSIEFSINLSVEDILNSETVYFLRQKMDEYELHSRVVLEITESEGIENFIEVSSFIEDMKSRSVKIAVDDFGSGYSNFEYLIKLNMDYIKIDGSIIRNIDTDINCRVVTETIVEFANKLGIKTIAEYVHSQAVFKIIKSIGVDYAQGYYLGKPAAIF